MEDTSVMIRRIFFILVFCLAVTPLSSQPREMRHPADIAVATTAHRFERDFKYAILRVLPEPEAKRLWTAVITGDNTDRQQVLRANAIYTLNDFLNRIDVQLRPLRLQIERLEVAFDNGDTKVERQINTLENRHSGMKLSTGELSALIYFYQWYDAKENALILGRGFTRVDTRVANQAIRVTRWAYVPRRTHGINAPAPRFDVEKWTEIFLSFSHLGLTTAFDELWALLVNFEGRHQTYRHIEGFSDRFYRRVRTIALKGDPFFARKLFFASLSNTRSQGMIERRGEDLGQWPQRKSVIGSNAYFMLALAGIKDGAQLIRFFGQGHLPPSIHEPRTELALRAIGIFKAEGSMDHASVSAAIKACRRR